jgi:HAD superfamily hydrolase (TIGR01509 family)
MFDNMPAAPIMKDADALLDCIRDAGMQRILVTGSGQTKLFDRLNEAFPGHFNENSMVTAFDVKQGKPFPEPYLMGLKKAGVAANEAIVIENAPLGVQAGRAAGIFTIAVNTGLLEDEVLLDAGCNLLFHNMSELKAAWPEIIKAIQL